MTGTSRLSIQKRPCWRAERTYTHTNTCTQIYTGTHNHEACLHAFINITWKHKHVQVVTHTHTLRICQKQEKLLYKQNVSMQTTMSANALSTRTHTQNIYLYPGDGWVSTHIDHLLIYRSSKHCKQWHRFFCFHKIHTQFIHLLEANQCDSVDVECISLT